jgi:ferredoxin
MIVAERKPYDEILAMLAGKSRILVAGCGTCVAVCSTGGEKQVGLLASELRMTAQMKGLAWEVSEAAAQRQCEEEFLVPLAPLVANADAVLSLACGAGVQLLAEKFPSATVLPAVNTTFLGANVKPGVWAEYCRGCGDCLLDETGGICPIARCSKSLIHGPCGGTTKGMCEVDPQRIECGWYLIFKRLQALGRLDYMKALRPPKDYAPGPGGGPRRLTREELTTLDAPGGEAAAKPS